MMKTNEQGKMFSLRLTEEEVFMIGRSRSRYSCTVGRLFKLLFLALVVGFISGVFIDAELYLRLIVMAAPFLAWFVYLSYIVTNRNKDAMTFLDDIKRKRGVGIEQL